MDKPPWSGAVKSAGKLNGFFAQVDAARRRTQANQRVCRHVSLCVVRSHSAGDSLLAADGPFAAVPLSGQIVRMYVGAAMLVSLLLFW
jgi:hypothetical protein